MEDKVDVLSLILADLRDIKDNQLKDIKDNQKEMRAELTVKFSTIHKRIDDMVKDKSRCEIASINRDNELEKQMWKTSGIVAGIIAFVFELAKWILAKIIK